MKYYQSFITVALAAFGLLCGTFNVYSQGLPASGKVIPEEIMKAPVKSWKLSPRQQNYEVPVSTRKNAYANVTADAASSGSQPVIYAAMINRSTWGSSMEYGIYSFTPTEYSFDLVKRDFNFNANGGASYIGDNNYLSVNTTDFGGFQWIEMHAYDTGSWVEVYNTMGDESIIATDMTYCEADNKVYGCFNNDSGTGYVFGIFDQDKFERTAICDLDEAWIACGADANGTIYAVTLSGILITADKQSGAINEIGNTGLTSSNLTSGAIDISTGLFYVATCNDDGSALYQVDIADATTQLLYNMPDGEELVGMYVARQALDPSAPAAVTDLRAQFADNSLTGTVAFTLPSTTVGGAQGSGDLSYSVSCGNRTLASGSGQYGKAVSESVTFEAAGVYDITVVVSNSTAAGPASSVTVTVTSATSGDDELIELPYNETFSSQSDFDRFSVIDVNKDGSTWVFRSAYNCALCQFSATNVSDDYLVTRPVMLEKEKNYVLTCDLWRRGAPYTEAYRLVMGKSPDPKSLTTVLRPEQSITDDNIHKETIFIKPAETGIYYIAVHCVSPADAYGLCVDNLTISTGALSSAPQAPAISVKPDFNGEKEATINIVAPTTDLEGNSISKINSLTVRRDGEIIRVFDNPSPGETLTYKDEVVTDGYYSYEVYATNDSGNSHSASEKVFVGVNYAAPPTNVSIVESVDNVGTVTMKWNAPETDSDGNPINPDLVTYMIGHRMSGSNLTIVKRGIKGTEYTFQALDPEKEEQKFVTYLIFSETDRGINDWTITQTSPIAVGKPYEMPYRETFGGDNLSQLLIATSHQSATWSISDDVADQDGDGSYLMYKGIVGATGTLTTAKVAVSGNSPVFSLWYMCIEDADDEIVVSVDSGNGFTDIASICIGDGDPYVWTKASVPLSDYVGRSVQIKLTYRTLAYRLAIDNLSVETPGKLNLSARGISVPYIVNPGVPFDVSLYVTNNGTENPGKFTSDLYRNGVKVSTVTTDGLDPFESVTIKFSDVLSAMADNPTGYFAVVNCQNDADESDNITAEATVDIEQLDYPAPTSLTAQGSGNMVWLSWNEVEISRENIHLTDGLENLVTFSTGLSNTELYNDNIGDWTTVHADGGQCYVMQVAGSYLRFPNANSKTGFIVFDPEKAGVPEKVMDRWKGHNGSSQYFLAMATIGFKNDKWLISPLLSEKEQTISFYAKSPLDDYGLESFEVLYSSEGKELSDFKKIGEVIASVPVEWTKYSYNLPAGAKYFAIRSTSDDVYALVIDDIEFEKAHPHRSLVHQGYRVYRDAEAVNSEPISGTDHFISEYPDGQSHIYNVTALYATGESAPSNDASLTTAIDDIAEPQPSIETGAGYVAIRNAAGKSVSIYRTDGVMYFKGLIEDDVRISLVAGIYIVEISGKATKVVVK